MSGRPQSPQPTALAPARWLSSKGPGGGRGADRSHHGVRCLKKLAKVRSAAQCAVGSRQGGHGFSCSHHTCGLSTCSGLAVHGASAAPGQDPPAVSAQPSIEVRRRRAPRQAEKSPATSAGAGTPDKDLRHLQQATLPPAVFLLRVVNANRTTPAPTAGDDWSSGRAQDPNCWPHHPETHPASGRPNAQSKTKFRSHAGPGQRPPSCLG